MKGKIDIKKTQIKSSDRAPDLGNVVGQFVKLFQNYESNVK